MRYQLGEFQERFGEWCEFEFIDGPHISEVVAPIRKFEELGLKGPYKRWSQFKYRDGGSGPKSPNWYDTCHTPAEVNYLDVTKSIQHIIAHIKRQQHPYDGFASFSQGGFMVAALIKTLQYFRKQVELEFNQYFWIDFSTVRGKLGTFEFNNRFISSEYFIPAASIHFVALADKKF